MKKYILTSLGIILLILVAFAIRAISYSPFGGKAYQYDSGLFYDGYQPMGEEGKLALFAEPDGLSSQLESATLEISGYERDFSYYAPNNLAEKPSIVFVLHGSGDDGKVMRVFTGFEFDELADEHGFIVVYPDGFGGGWNEIRSESPLKANKLDVDDIAFFKEMLVYLENEFQTEIENIFTFGYSNGGQMAFRMAFELPDQLRAIATVGSSLPLPDFSDVSYDSPPYDVSVMLVHGTEDGTVPFEGGEISMMGILNFGEVYSANDTAQYWVNTYELGPTPKISQSGAIEIQEWVELGKPRVTSYIIHGGGHTIPNQRFQFSEQFGITNQEMSTVNIAWKFFQESLK